MHVAVVMSALVLGGWVLNDPESEDQAGVPGEVQQQDVMPSSPTSTTTQAPKYPYEGTSPQSGSRPRDTQGGGQASAPSGGQSIRSQMPTYIPTPPTDTSTDAFGQPTAPTSMTGRRAQMQPTPPTQSSSLAGQSGFEQKMKSPLTRGPASHGNAGAAPSPASDKAFAGYQPQSGVSPYMNLFRIGGETIDNYTSLVRPQIEQRFLNQQFNRDIRTLNNTSQTQRVDLQQLYRTNQSLQGVATPQYYMNYGSYYPGSGQPQ